MKMEGNSSNGIVRAVYWTSVSRIGKCWPCVKTSTE